MTQLTRTLPGKSDRFFAFPPAETVLNVLLVGTIAIVLALVVVVTGTQGIS